MVGAGGLGVQVVVHGSVNQLGPLGRKRADDRNFSGSRIFCAAAARATYGRGASGEGGLHKQRRIS